LLILIASDPLVENRPLFHFSGEKNSLETVISKIDLNFKIKALLWELKQIHWYKGYDQTV